MLKVGIVGLPNVGKSTLFNAITNLEIEAVNYPFATIEPNIGIVNVKDKRVDYLFDLYESNKKIYNQIQFIDIAGLVKGASEGKGLGNKFLANIREVDVIVQVVRLFQADDIVHVEGNVDSIRDIQIIDYELIFSDIEQIMRWKEKNNKKYQFDKKLKSDFLLMEKILEILKTTKKLSEVSFSEKDIEFLNQFNFLTLKPTIYVANVSEKYISSLDKNREFNIFLEFVKKYNYNYHFLSAQIEYEISKLNINDQKEFLESLGLKSSGINELSILIFKFLKIKTFFTAGKKEIHAWSFKEEITAPKAAGLIHSDFEKGFIKAEIFNINDFKRYPSEELIRSAGKIKLEGKEYKINDGDIVHFRFNN